MQTVRCNINLTGHYNSHQYHQYFSVSGCLHQREVNGLAMLVLDKENFNIIILVNTLWPNILNLVARAKQTFISFMHIIEDIRDCRL